MDKNTSSFKIIEKHAAFKHFFRPLISGSLQIMHCQSVSTHSNE